MGPDILTVHERLIRIEAALEEHDRELEDIDARVEEVEVGQGLEDGSPASVAARLRDYQIEQPEQSEPHDGAKRIGVVDGVDMWTDENSRHPDGMFFVSSEGLRMDTNQFSGVWATPSTLRDLASIAEIEMGNRGGD